ncbi:MAG: hypothetical protein K2Y02_03130 [Burkholderiaceae bacterium]|nr:hypothetical protein [Burkholderiaceae bacterium]
MAAQFKKGDPVKAKSARSGAVKPGKFVKSRPTKAGDFYDIYLGAEGGVKSFRPSMVSPA